MKVEQRLWSREGRWQPSVDEPTLSGAQVVFLFGSIEQVQESECFARVRHNYPEAHVFGCTTAGQIHDTRVLDGTIALTAVELEHSRVELTRASIESPADSARAGQRLVEALPREGLRHVFVLSEGLRVNASELVHGIDAALPAGVTVSGGCAGDGNKA
jgi:hypothetical protein